MEIFAEIQNLDYKPHLCRVLPEYNQCHLKEALLKDSNFVLNYDGTKKYAVSKWVSPKRTRSYPYGRVYDTLCFSCKKITIIPILKDEGADGDRDFLQWDTISLMSLFNVFVIISYYDNATKNPNYDNKITNQVFNNQDIEQKINQIHSYQFSALHWNISQLENIFTVGESALDSYARISKNLNVKMHSVASARNKVNELKNGLEQFKKHSRDLAQQAQSRESVTVQPKESVSGEKAKITIKNFLGGHYFFTCDEYALQDDKVFLIEAKHTKDGQLPKLPDIQDGLLKMALFTNLTKVFVGDKPYIPVAVLKLTTSTLFNERTLSSSDKQLLLKLKEEAKENRFKIQINGQFLNV